MQQLLSKKNTMSTDITQRQAKTGQVTGGDKNSRVSDTENFGLSAIGADYALKEFMSSRADDMVAKAQMQQAINTNGYVSIKDLETDVSNKQALNTLDVYFLGAGIVTDLITPGLALNSTLQGKEVKASPGTKYNK